MLVNLERWMHDVLLGELLFYLFKVPLTHSIISGFYSVESSVC
jgi:hypothetical protein